VELGEGSLQAAKRELSEETGISGEKVMNARLSVVDQSCEENLSSRECQPLAVLVIKVLSVTLHPPSQVAFFGDPFMASDVIAKEGGGVMFHYMIAQMFAVVSRGQKRPQFLRFPNITSFQSPADDAALGQTEVRQSLHLSRDDPMVPEAGSDAEICVLVRCRGQGWRRCSGRGMVHGNRD
jgi:ADP-ribose pyrophosphatase YjhB (NUDIX family)